MTKWALLKQDTSSLVGLRLSIHHRSTPKHVFDVKTRPELELCGAENWISTSSSGLMRHKSTPAGV
ncbi:hypothetical protein AVEN_127232-1, partial [Araneus ventricosus]